MLSYIHQIKQQEAQTMQALKLVVTAEQLIERYKDLQVQQKHLEAEMSSIKKQLIAEYLTNTDTLTGAHGILLATYKEQIRIAFDTTRFKQEHAKMYDDYCEPKAVRTFLVK
jgi:predicted phage-related endonuclease